MEEVANTNTTLSPDKKDDPDRKYPLRAVFNEAESHLMKHSECDMLTIMDCCYASNIQRRLDELEDSRTYILLTASHHDRPTEGPGERSFTTALITSLREFLQTHGDKPFTITELRQRINVQEWRLDNPCTDWHRLKRYEAIFLGRLQETPDTRFDPSPVLSELTIRLPLSAPTLSDSQIVALARGISKVVKAAEVPAKKVEWLRFRSARARTLGLSVASQLVSKWHSAGKRAKERARILQEATTHHQLDAAETEETSPSQSKDLSGWSDTRTGRLKRRRSHEQDMGHGHRSIAKKQTSHHATDLISAGSLMGQDPLTPNSERYSEH